MAEADFVPYLIQGIYFQQFRAVLLKDPPNSVTTFIQNYRILGVNVARAPDKETDATFLKNRLEAQAQKITELRARMNNHLRPSTYAAPNQQ